MCSPVEHYVCFYLSFFLYEIEESPENKNSLSPVKTISGVPGKVVYLHYITVYCACLSVVFLTFRSGSNLAELLPCLERASHYALRVCCQKNVLLCLMDLLSHLVFMLEL